MKALFWFIVSNMILWLAFYLGDTFIPTHEWARFPLIITAMYSLVVSIFLAIKNIE